MFHKFIGKTVKDIYTLSFYIDDEKITDTILVYFLLDTWYSVVLCEGSVTCEKLGDITPKDMGDESFKYLVTHRAYKDEIYLSEFTHIKKYLWKNDPEQCYGITFFFKNGSSLVLFEEESDNLIVCDNDCGHLFDDNYSEVDISFT